MNKEIRTVTRQLARFGLQESDLLFTWDQKPTIAEKLLRRILTNTGLTIDELPTLEDAEWANTVKNASYGVERRGGECIINPLEEEIPLADIDLYMKGIIRWMNELGLYTLYCCDGHGRRTPYVSLFSYPSSKQLRLLHACAPVGMTIRPQGKKLLLQCQNPTELLLQFAERLHQAWSDPAALVELEAEQFKPSLLHLLSISGESGNEGRIRQFLRSRLTPMTDTLFVDRAGNLCGTVLCGEGPTVLLSAHMDLYEELAPDRQILQQGTVLSSSKGILGGDDRAGIAIILEVLRHFHQTNFNGTLKVAFTVKEEIGLIGAKKLDPSFLADVDAAIVVDRRGTRDIVTSCRGIIPFCPPSYGELFERAGVLANMPDWKITEGGSSDARILSEVFGIPAVNLSAGYQNEHTEEETLDYLASYQTVKLIVACLHHQLIKEKSFPLN